MSAQQTGAQRQATSTPGQQRSSRKGNTTFAGLEFFKFSLIAGIVGLLLAGYSHVDTVYNWFGLALHEVGIGYLETMEFTVFMLRQHDVLYYSIGVILLFSAAAAAIRYCFDDFGFYVCLAILLLVLAFLAGYAGSHSGKAYVDDIIEGKAGRHAYCALKNESDFEQDIWDDFKRLTTERRFRMIKMTEEAVFLHIAPPPGTSARQPSEGDHHGDHIVIPMDGVGFCRVSSGSAQFH